MTAPEKPRSSLHLVIGQLRALEAVQYRLELLEDLVVELVDEVEMADHTVHPVVLRHRELIEVTRHEVHWRRETERARRRREAADGSGADAAPPHDVGVVGSSPARAGQ